MNDSLSTGYHFVKLCQEKRLASSQKMQEPVPMLEYSLPRLPLSWTWASLSEVCERVSVGHVGATTQYFVDSNQGVPLIRSQDVRPGKLMLKNAARVSFDFYRKQKKSQLKVGDVLIVRVGANRGDVCVVSHGVGEINCANIVFARPIHPNGFIGYYFQSEYGRELLLSVTTGSAQGVINTQTIARIPVPIPPLETQRKIVSILSAYDDLIENNARRIEILEEMARSLYREWFVNFRFPGHEQVKMVDSELGLIPEGWEALTVNNIGAPGKSIVSGPFGSNIGKKFFVEEGVPVIRGNNLTLRNKKFIDNGFVFVTEQKAHELRNCEALPDDIVFTAAGTLGQVGIIPKNPKYQKYIISNKQLRLRCNKDIALPEYIYYWLSTPEMREHIINQNTGSSVPLITLGTLRKIPVLLPSMSTQHQFAAFVVNRDNLVENLERKNTNLRQTRNLLLSKLISGEIDVEKFNINIGELTA